LLTDRTWATQVANVVRAHWQRPAP
jgi:hypothetical protein